MNGEVAVAFCVDKVGLWWPLAEEDQLRRAAEAYAQCALAVRGATTTAQTGAKLVTADNHGKGVDAFAKHWATYNGDCTSGLPATASACTAASQGLEQFAQRVEDAKNRVMDIAAEIAAFIVAGIATSLISFGIGSLTSAARVGMLIRKVLVIKAGLSVAAAAAVTSLASIAAGGALAGFIDSMVAQTLQIAWSDRESIDFGRAMTSAGFGAVAAPLGAVAFRGLAKAAANRSLSRAMAGKPDLLAELRTLVPDTRQLDRLLRAVRHPRKLRNYLDRMSPGDLERAIATTQRSGIPQGFTRVTFDDFSERIRTGAGHFGDDIRIAGSRAVGAAKPKGDIDLAIRVSSERFDQIMIERFGSLTGHPPNLQKVIDDSIRKGKISKQDLGLMKFLTSLGHRKDWDVTKVDLAVIRVGGEFDRPPFLRLP